MTPISELVSALRSGKFKQLYQGFRKGDRFSVHALACEVYRTDPKANASWQSSWDGDEFVIASKHGIEARSSITMPSLVWKWFGFTGSDPVLNVRIKYSNLRPEVDGQIEAALAEAEKQDKETRERSLAKYRAWESWWKETRTQYHETPETLMALNDDLQMTFDQIASVLSQLEK